MSPMGRVHPQDVIASSSNHLDEEHSLLETPTYRLVELLIRCKDLQPESEKTNYDTYCVMLQRKFGQWKEYDRTEILFHSSSPNYCHSFTLEHHIDTYDEKFRFEVYIVTRNSKELNKQQIIGHVEINSSEFMDRTQSIQTSSHPLLAAGYSKPRGHLCITSEVIRPTRSKVVFNIGGSQIKKKSIIGNKKPDTILELARSIDALEYHPIHRTPVCCETSEPRWKPFDISLEKLCNSDKKRQLRFSVIHHSKDGPVLIGELETNLQKLQDIVDSKSRIMILRKSVQNTSKDSLKEKGKLRIFDLIVEHHFSFLDYVRGGCICNLFVGIDFTLSNGSFESDESFHAHKDNEENGNIYQPAIESVLNMFTPYLNNAQMSTFGFGAKLPGSNEVNHCFSLHSSEGEIKTYENLIERYFKILPTLKFAGPTYLAPLLKEVTEEVKKQSISQRNQQYSYLLIFSDGVLNDMEEFKLLLNDVRDLPLSVLIVGVGPMDLKALECFDSREEATSLLTKSKMQAKCRQNVHFFHFKSKSLGSKKMVSEGFTTLASQLVSYMKQRQITPNEPVVQQMNGSARVYEINELRASIKRRKSFKKAAAATSTLSLTNCPTCGHIIEESTNL